MSLGFGRRWIGLLASAVLFWTIAPALGCEPEAGVELLSVDAVTPEELELGSVLKVVGSGYPIGRDCTVWLEGDVRAQGWEPVEGDMRAQGSEPVEDDVHVEDDGRADDHGSAEGAGHGDDTVGGEAEEGASAQGRASVQDNERSAGGESRTVRVSLAGKAVSEEQVEVVVDRDVLEKLGGNGFFHGIFEGTVRAAFPCHDGESQVTGSLSGVRLGLTPDLPRGRVAVQRPEQRLSHGLPRGSSQRLSHGLLHGLLRGSPHELSHGQGSAQFAQLDETTLQFAWLSGLLLLCLFFLSPLAGFVSVDLLRPLMAPRSTAAGPMPADTKMAVGSRMAPHGLWVAWHARISAPIGAASTKGDARKGDARRGDATKGRARKGRAGAGTGLRSRLGSNLRTGRRYATLVRKLDAVLRAGLVPMAASALFIGMASAKSLFGIGVDPLVMCLGLLGARTAAVLTGMSGHGFALRLRAAALHVSRIAAVSVPVACACALTASRSLDGMVAAQGALPWQWLAFTAPGLFIALPLYVLAAASSAQVRRIGQRVSAVGGGESGSAGIGRPEKKSPSSRLLELLDGVVICGVGAAVFFGGWQTAGLPLVDRVDPHVSGPIVFLGKAWLLGYAIHTVHASRAARRLSPWAIAPWTMAFGVLACMGITALWLKAGVSPLVEAATGYVLVATTAAALVLAALQVRVRPSEGGTAPVRAD